MKRVVSSSIVSVVILLLIAGGFFYFQIHKNENASVFKVIPADVAWMASVNPSSGDLQRIAKSNFFNGSDSVATFKKWQSVLLYFDSLCVNDVGLKAAFENSTLFCTGHLTGSSVYELMFFCSLSSAGKSQAEELLSDVFKNEKNLQSRNYNGIEIHELILYDGSKFSWAVTGSVFIGSSASFLVEDAIRLQKEEKAVSPAAKLEEVWPNDPNKVMVAIRYAGLAKWMKALLNSAATEGFLSFDKLCEWTYFQLDMHSGLFSFKGETLASDSSAFIHCFDDQQEVERKLINWLPAKTAAVVMWGMSDPLKFFKAMEKRSRSVEFAKSEKGNEFRFYDWIGNEVALVVTQPAVNFSDNNFIALLSVRDSLKCMNSLSQLSGQYAKDVEYYNGYAIRYLDKKDLLQGVFGSLFKRVNRFYYTAVNEHLVIANQASVLRAYINDVRTGNLLINEDRFKSLSVHIPSQGNILLFSSVPPSVKILNMVASGEWKNRLSDAGPVLNNWNGFTMSVSCRNGIFHTSGCLGYFDKNSSGPQSLWNAKLDTTISAGPFFPDNANGLILVEDVNQQLYAFDLSGDLKWKKKLETPLLGTISTVDYYKNGSCQYLFNTHSFIYLIDSAGNTTGNYPFRLPAEASAGLSIIKDAGNENEKIYIPCKNLRLYAYSVIGKPLPGFTPMKLPGVISLPVYFITDNSRMVLVEENGLCFVSDLYGERLFTVKGSVQTYEKSSLFRGVSGKDLFSFLGADGVVYDVDSSGLTSRIAVHTEDSVFSMACSDFNGDGEGDWILGGNHGFSALTTDGITLFRFNTEEKIDAIVVFLHEKKNFVFVSSGHKIYLFNRDGSIIEGFPVNGSGLPAIASSIGRDLYVAVKEGIDNISLYLLPY